MKCNKCGIDKPESEFYLKGHTVNGKYYVNLSGQCKECILQRAKLKRMGLLPERKEKQNKMNWDNKLGGLTISDTQYEEKKQEKLHPDLWVIRNLKNYGNCYINGKHDLNYIEQQLGCKIKVKAVEVGYIILVEKGGVNSVHN